MTPQKPEPYAEDKVTYPVYVQPYLQGIRTLYQNGAFQSECDWSSELKLLAENLADIFPKKVVLDGVMYEGKYKVFDVVSFKIPFKYRWDTIAQIMRDAHAYYNLRITNTYRVNNKKQADDQLSWRLNEGYTGMIYRLNPCLYTKPTPKNPDNHNPQLLLREIT